MMTSSYNTSSITDDIRCPKCNGSFARVDVVGAKYRDYLQRRTQRTIRDRGGRLHRVDKRYTRSNTYFIRCPHCNTNIDCQIMMRCEIQDDAGVDGE